MKYIYHRKTEFHEERMFCAGLMVPDLAKALTSVTGSQWTFTRESHESPGFDGPYWRAGVIRIRDGLAIAITREAYNKPLRGEASIWWERSGCGVYGRKVNAKCTFSHDRDLLAIARQIDRAVIQPNAEDVTRLRQEHSAHTSQLADVSHQLQSLAAMPGVSVRGAEGGSRFVSVGPLTFRCSENGYLQPIASGSLTLADMPALAEHFASMARQLAR